MACGTATPPSLADAARACSQTAAEVQHQLDLVRRLMMDLDAGRLGVSPERLQALLIGYDIYVCMLTDALADIAAGLRVRQSTEEAR